MKMNPDESYHREADIQRVKECIHHLWIDPSVWDSVPERDTEACLSEWTLDPDLSSRFVSFALRLRTYNMFLEHRDILLFVEMWMSSRDSSVAYTLLAPPLRKSTSH